LPRDQDIGWTPIAWLIYLPALFAWPMTAPSGTGAWALTTTVTGAFLVLYFRAYWVRNTREMIWIIGAIAALGMALTPFNPGAPVLTIYAASFAGTVRPVRQAVILTGCVVVAAALEAWVLHFPPTLWAWQIFISIIVAFSTGHFARVRETNVRLREANEQIAHLAKVAERERIARDLHDLLGHTLSLITLKASLASRLSANDPARAANEIRDVERISRDALSEVRAAVAGYRDAGLTSELGSVESMLTAAGIQLHTDIHPVELSSTEDAVLALILRESVTNVVRHAHATRCDVTLMNVSGMRVLTIHDNGRGKKTPDGNGITGIRERAHSLGGDVTINSASGTCIGVTLPVVAAMDSAAPAPAPAPAPARLTVTV
jgi:two-component system sensor histidine kinase DesK